MRVLALVCVALAAAGCAGPGSSDERPVPGAVGTAAPAYAAPTLTGDSISLAGLQGRVVLLNVWATWCIPCRKEMPELQALHTEYAARGLEIVGVSIDESGSEERIPEFLRDFGITYTILRDPAERVADAFGIIGVPASFLIDRNGIIAWRHLGPFSRADAALVAALQKAL